MKKYFLSDSLQAAQSVSLLDSILPQMRSADSILKISLHKDSIYIRDVLIYQPTDSLFSQAKNSSMMYFRKYGITPDMSLGRFIGEAEEYLQMSRNELRVFSGDPNEVRRKIAGDHYNDPDDKNYGNNNISAGNPEHGTHISGIIAASRGNGKGMDGIDGQVYIMPLRVVPEGDERDKDIALALRYAVDNGALVINMSFGKYLSPGEKMGGRCHSLCG